jgi:hypothetical protein
LGNPIEDVLEIGERLIVADELHAALRTQSRDALTCLSVRYQLAISIGSATADLGHLCIGQSHVVHMLDVIE